MPTFVPDSAAEGDNLKAAKTIAPEAPGNSNTAASSGADDMRSVNQQLILLIALLLFYCAPVITVFLVSLFKVVFTGTHAIEGPIVELVQQVVKEPKNYTNTITQMLVPVASALTAANHRSIFLSSWSSALFLLPLAAVFCSIMTALLFSVFTSKIGSDSEVISQFFLNTASTLAVYVMMLVGLQMADQRGVAK